ncbi:hypothetical protein LWI29_026121 [Acer saccharum]|uniref:Uncharacterized protein n=1 Tax=Acer saccharum TaxID=4024 RepID=A0AA39SSX0_ACESA|nr:hypothetical protein LWI29_026121 [Acer saccharum]
MEQRKQELRGRPALNMMIPINVFEGSSKDHHGRMAGESGDEALDEDIEEDKEVQVKVLVKHELEEKQDIKRLVLEYNDREEDSNGLGTQTLNSHWISSGINSHGKDLAGEPVAHITGIIIIQAVGSITADESELFMAKEAKNSSYLPAPQLREPCLLERGLLITLTLDDLAR